MGLTINSEFCDVVQDARSAEHETVRGCTASVRTPRNAAMRAENELRGMTK